MPQDVAGIARTQKNSASNNIARFLQSLDSDGDPSNGIDITPTIAHSITSTANIQTAPISTMSTIVTVAGKSLVSEASALAHLKSTTSEVVGSPVPSFSNTPTVSSSSSSSSGSSSSSSSSSSSTAASPSLTPTNITVVDGYVKNALVKDANGNVATYQNNGTYTFADTPAYPIIVSGGQLLDTNKALDINLTAQEGTVVSPITTFLGNDSALLLKFLNLGLNKLTLSDFSVDYVDTNDTKLSKLSQLLYAMIGDTTLLSTFKTSVENNDSLDSLDKLFTLAQSDIANSPTLGSTKKVLFKNFLTHVEAFDGSASDMENNISAYKTDVTNIKNSGNPFTIVMETNATDQNMTIPINSDYNTYNFFIDWGDGNVSSGNDSNVSHDYGVDGNQTIKIYGTFPAIQFDGGGDKDYIKMITAWGDTSWRDFNGSFNGCSNLELNATDTPDLSQVTDLEGMFAWTTKFNTNINDWNVSNVTDMTGLFYATASFNQPLNNWDVSNVTIMRTMFSGATVFNKALNDWNTSGVTSMYAMFGSATSFNQSLSNWNVSSVTDMGDMFRSATSFNQSLSNWNTSSDTNMSKMFYDATSFTDQNLSSWDVSNVTDHTDFNNTNIGVTPSW